MKLCKLTVLSYLKWIYVVDFELKCKNGTVRKKFAVQGAEWIRQPQGCDLIRKTIKVGEVLIRANGAERGNSWAAGDLFTENERQVLQANTDSLNEEFGSWSRESLVQTVRSRLLSNLCIDKN
jgi:hypothetical protein